MVEATNQSNQSNQSGKIALKTSDGEILKIDIEIACKQSSFISEYVENEKTEYENQIGNMDGIEVNEVPIDLAEQKMMTSSILSKIFHFWVHVETKCAFPELKKPLTSIQNK